MGLHILTLLMSMISITQSTLGSIEGQDVVLYTLTNSSGATVELLNLGATIASTSVADKDGAMRQVVLGFEDYTKYMGDGAALGKSVGRFANRIAKGRFTLDGKEYTLAINNGENHLHGGPTGFMNRIWESSIEGDSVVFTYTAADGEEGFPSAITVKAIYTWSEDCNLSLVYEATTDDATIVNLTNHVYFNLNGESSGDIYSHTLKLNSSYYLPTDNTQIPTGELAPVASTPMDFTAPKAIGKDINADFEPLKIGSGYDHCWVIDNFREGEMNPVAELYSAESGIRLDVSSTQPGVQIYTGNWLEGTGVSKAGKEHHKGEGVAIECQNYPDAPNKPQFPSCVLRKGEIYSQRIDFKFGL